MMGCGSLWSVARAAWCTTNRVTSCASSHDFCTRSNVFLLYGDANDFRVGESFENGQVNRPLCVSPTNGGLTTLLARQERALEKRHGYSLLDLEQNPDTNP